MKEKLRKETKIKREEKRTKHSKEENIKKSKEIKEKLFNLKEFKDAETILFYVSYNGEVFTHDMICELFYKKNIIVPLSNKENHTLTLSHLKSWEELCIGSYNILEPSIEKIRETKIQAIDLIIVPGVAFDEHGGRLGHGKGYYDRLLSESKDIFKIGLCFEFQIFDNIPMDEHDVYMDLIVTEKRIIDCKK
jgi:5-formyltetrahydrofolate cyclo-ligase